MIKLLYIFLLGIILSIDAFSVALNIGWQINNKKKELVLCAVVGIFHLIMPLCGGFLASKIEKIVTFNTNVFMGIVLLFIGVISIFNLKENRQAKSLSLFTIISIAISVSLDSFSLGMALYVNQYNILLCGVVFSICSSLITLSGVFLSKYLSNLFEKNFKIVGILLLLFLGIIHILK